MNEQAYFSQIMDLFITYHGGRLDDEVYDIQVLSLRDAFQLACSAHIGQKRKSGEAFVFHSLRVALEAAKHGMDCTALVSALLHDVVEDTEFGIDEIRSRFGEKVALIVDGLTKPDVTKSCDSSEKNYYIRQLLAQVKDYRLLFLKIFDRLDNMQTLGALPEYKQRSKAIETEHIYVPCARLLRMVKVASELESLSFKVINHDKSDLYDSFLSRCMEQNHSDLGRLRDEIFGALDSRMIRAKLHDRWRGLNAAAWEKRKGGLASLYTLVIEVNDLAEVYQSLGVLHGLYHPIPFKLKDHLYQPSKGLNYQAVKTTIQANRLRVRVEITTGKLLRFADLGYLCPGFHPPAGLNEFLSSLASGEDLFDTQALKQAMQTVQVFTPKGELITMPDGATALDLAFHVHHELGLKSRKAVVSGKPKSLNHKLLDGDIIEIVESEKFEALPKWLFWAVTPKARNAIRRYLRSLANTPHEALDD